jgi:hypothetical protein
MNINQLVGRHVEVRATDLFGTTVAAVIRAVDADDSMMLLEFVSSVHIDTNTYQYAVARPRLEIDTLEVFLSSGIIGCGLTYDRYNSSKPFDLSWWRGGGATIADLVL